MGHVNILKDDPSIKTYVLFALGRISSSSVEGYPIASLCLYIPTPTVGLYAYQLYWLMNPAGGLTNQSQKQLMGSHNPTVPPDVLLPRGLGIEGLFSRQC